MKKTLIFSDSHLEAGVDFDPAYSLIKNMVKKEKFDKIVCLGDMMDFPYISRWVEGMPGLTEGKRLKEDFKLFESELIYLRKYTKEMIFATGNHCDRVLKYLQRNPVLEGILSLNDICEQAGVQYIATEHQPFKLRTDLYASHGLSLTKYCYAQNMERAGCSIITGHAHRTGVHSYRYPDGRTTTGYSIGTTGPLNPLFIAGTRLAGWTQSFAILYESDTSFQIDIIMIENGKCIVAGKEYSID